MWSLWLLHHTVTLGATMARDHQLGDRLWPLWGHQHCRSYRHEDLQHRQRVARLAQGHQVVGAPAQIYNSGHITGSIDLSYQGDTFINQAGGVFETSSPAISKPGTICP